MVKANQTRFKQAFSFHKCLIIYIVLRLTSEIQNVPLHLCVFIFEKEIQKIRIQTFRSLHPISPALLPKFKDTSTGEHLSKKSYPFEDPDIGEEKTKRLCKARQGKGRRGCCNLKYLLFAPHDSKMAKPTSPSSQLQEG